MKKLSLIMALVLVFSCFLGTTAFAASEIAPKEVRLEVEGKPAGTAKIFTDNEVEYISLKNVATALGWHVSVDKAAKLIVLEKGGSKITIDPAEKFAVKDTFGVRLNNELKVIDGVTYIPTIKMMDLMEVRGSFLNNHYDIRYPQKTKISTFKNLGKAEQVIVVTAPEHDQTLVKIELFEKVGGNWKAIKTMKGVIGRNGFGDTKREGDGRSPVGKFTLGTAFGSVKNPGSKMPYIVTTTDDIWVDDSKSPYYNTWQKRSQISASSYDSKEDLLIDAYKYAFVIDYNTKNITPGYGSAIFFHVKGKGPTAGCTAVSEKNMVEVLKWLDPEKNPVIVQGAAYEVAGLK